MRSSTTKMLMALLLLGPAVAFASLACDDTGPSPIGEHEADPTDSGSETPGEDAGEDAEADAEVDGGDDDDAGEDAGNDAGSDAGKSDAADAGDADAKG